VVIGGRAGRARRMGLAAVAVAAGLLPVAFALPTPASAESIEAGETRLQLDRVLFDELGDAGVQISRFGKGKVQGRVVTLPVDGGLIDLGTASGSIDQAGGFKFRSGKRTVRMSELILDTAKRELYAKLDNKRLRIATLKSYSFSRAGFGDEVEVADLRLSRRTTGLLNRKLRVNRVFRPSRAFAAISSSFQPETVRMVSGSMQFSLDPGTVAKLKSLELDPVPFETTQLGSSPPTFGAPLLGGEIYPSASRSWASIEGGMRIAKLEIPEPPESPGITLPTLTWANLGLSLESQKVIGGVVSHNAAGQVVPSPGGPLAALDLAAATVQLDPQTRTLSIADARATLEAPFANLINETFATPKGKAPILAGGDPLGTFSLTMQVR
jgi:hypothetical protein